MTHLFSKLVISWWLEVPRKSVKLPKRVINTNLKMDTKAGLLTQCYLMWSLHAFSHRFLPPVVCPWHRQSLWPRGSACPIATLSTIDGVEGCVGLNDTRMLTFYSLWGWWVSHLKMHSSAEIDACHLQSAHGRKGFWSRKVSTNKVRGKKANGATKFVGCRGLRAWSTIRRWLRKLY